MKVVREISSMQEISNYFRSIGKKIAFVPTMGFLHEGHTSLMLSAKNTGDVVVASIFVNPTQFGEGEDFDKYPRDFKRDFHICEKSGVDFIFHPAVEEMYSSIPLTTITLSKISDKLEGAFRPGHFTGVATVVAKLLNIVRPHTMHMGSKDAQQNAVLKKMILDLNFDTRLIVCPTIREDNGLAKSSRNTYLSEEQKRSAGSLYFVLMEGKKMITEEKVSDAALVKQKAAEILSKMSPEIELQYYEITDNEMLEPLTDLNRFSGEVLISLAAKCGPARLIDNIIFEHNPNS
jgi:pantoate--beta-alanine ligase